MRTFDHNADPVEFSRMVTLTDGVFAIALTLLVLDLVAIPAQAPDAPLSEILVTAIPSFFAFAISVAVVGTYYHSHHEYVSMLKKIDGGLRGLTITFLGFIALIPFAQSLLSNRVEEALAFVLYAIVLGCASVIEALMLWHAHRRGLLREPLRGRTAWIQVLRHGLPIVLLFSSAGFTFLIGAWTVLFWCALWPLDSILSRLERQNLKIPEGR